MFDIQVINLGIRQNGREKENSVIDIKIPTVDKIYTEIMKIFSVTKRNKKRKIHGSGNASKKIIRHLENLSINEKLIQKQFNN